MSKYPQILSQVAGKLFINGQYVDSKGGKLFEVINPATEDIIQKAVAASQEDVDFAVQSARAAFQSVWKNYDPHERGRLLNKFADLIQQNAEWLAYYQSLNNGKTLSSCKAIDINATISAIRYYAGQTDKIKGKIISMSQPFMGFTFKEPIGVVGQIIPWNYPLLMVSWKIAPALAAGCTIVLKPAEQTPFTALMLGDLLNKAGFPPGVVNIVTGFGETGSFVSTHKGINKVSFTGSTQVGYIIMRTAHKHNLKPVTLQLGGKSANIICHDADLDKAVNQACVVFGNNGQTCTAPTRTFVHESIYDKFVHGCVNIVKKLTTGDPFDKKNTLGAIISQQQLNKILWYINEGKKQGATLAYGGQRIEGKGYFITPTIFSNVEDHMKIAKQEIFGPVMCILKWKDQQEVIKRANSLAYGLSSGVVTPNIDRALRFAKGLDAGLVFINGYGYIEPGVAFGGYKDSGIGRQLGDEGLQAYLTTKSVIIQSSI